MPKSLPKLMKAQYERAAGLDKRRDPHPNLIPYIDETNILNWFFFVLNLPAPYEGGVYIFNLRAPEAFPRKPPEFRFLTPNGVYEEGGKICISIGEYHAKDKAGKSGAYGWRPALGMIGFAREVVNGLLVPEALGGGIRILEKTPPEAKRRLAARSAEYNKNKHPALVRKLEAFCAEHPDHPAVRAHREASARRRLLAGASLFRAPKLLPVAFGENWAKVERHLAGERPSWWSPPPGEGAGEPGLLDSAARAVLLSRSREVRRVLALGLDAVATFVRPDNPPGEWDRALHEFLAGLPGVCGGACAESVPRAVARLAGGVETDPTAFLLMYGELTAFLLADDIDAKAALGRVFVEKSKAYIERGGVAPEKDLGGGVKGAP